jgi:tRNA1(Val) A37 N6-methylase TrmN6
MIEIHQRLMSDWTLHYHQPTSYRHCMEPVILAEWLVSTLTHTAPLRVLDIGAGCGVLGLEIVHRRPEWSLVSVEIQDIFEHHFMENRRLLLAERAKLGHEQCGGTVTLLKSDIRKVRGLEFDLSVGNLPFFNPESSLLSPDPVRNACRFFLNGGVTELLAPALAMTSRGGQVVALIREPESLSSDLPALLDQMQVIGRTFNVDWPIRIRKTAVLRMQRTS